MMTVLYDYRELQDRPGGHLRLWKVWHLITFGAIIVSGLANYVFLFNAETFVGDRCLLTPRQLAFHVVADPEDNAQATNVSAQEDTDKTIRDATNDTVTTIEVRNVTVFIANRTHRVMLDLVATLWGAGCTEAEYTPVLSCVVALVWIAMFSICPSNSDSRSGMQHGWRVLTPAMLSCCAMSALAGHSFMLTHGGLLDFCAGFCNYTNSTSCYSAAEFLPRARASWSFGAHAAGASAAAGAACAAWLCAGGLVLLRCVRAPDFSVVHTTVEYFDAERNPTVPPQALPSRTTPLTMEVASLHSEPTDSSLVVSGMAESDRPRDRRPDHDHDRRPDHDHDRRHDHDRPNAPPELLEMTHSKPELKLTSHQ